MTIQGPPDGAQVKHESPECHKIGAVAGISFRIKSTDQFNQVLTFQDQGLKKLSDILPEFSVNRISRPEIQCQQKCTKKAETHPPHQRVFNAKEIHAMEESTGHEE